MSKVKVHVPGAIQRQVVEPKPRPRVVVEDVSTTRHAELDTAQPIGLADTLTRTSHDPRPVLNNRAFTGFVLLLCACLVLLAMFQWATGLTDDIRSARTDAHVTRERCGR